MGSRHNRKRTRSRPRNRSNRNSSSVSSIGSFTHSSSIFSSSPFAQRPPNHWHQQYSQWQQRVQQEKTLQHQRAKYEHDVEAERVRMFGGEAGDEFTLCAPMLDVVMRLFNGSIDYQDP
jgi:hypothetical protein